MVPPLVPRRLALRRLLFLAIAPRFGACLLGTKTSRPRTRPLAAAPSPTQAHARNFSFLGYSDRPPAPGHGLIPAIATSPLNSRASGRPGARRARGSRGQRGGGGGAPPPAPCLSAIGGAARSGSPPAGRIAAQRRQ